MGKRAAGRDGPKNINIPTTPKLRNYLWDLAEEEGYGKDVTDIARTLIYRAIEELIAKGVLTRRPGKVDEE